MFSLFRRRGTAVLAEEGDNASARRDRRRPTSLQLCMQLALACACVVILLFGLSVSAIGFWGYTSQQEYLDITERNPDLTRLPISMMVTGGFVAALGLVGALGSLFSRTITGQILLGMFAFVLVLIIVSEVGAGASAIRLQFNLESVFLDTALESQTNYINSNETAERWDDFQRKHKCCGATGYEDDVPPYYHVFENVSVPMSCCKSGVEDMDCEVHSDNATEYREYINDLGCSSVAVDGITGIMTAIAIVTIVTSTAQLPPVFLAVVVAYMSSKLDNEKNTNYSYNKLLQEEENHQEDNGQPTSILL
jgi:hypothetical protein